MFNCIDSDLSLNLPKLTKLTITRLIGSNFLQI
jgi:hypothetical protein